MKVKQALKFCRVGEILIPESDADFYRSKGRTIFYSHSRDFRTIAGNLYIAPDYYQFKAPFDDAIQIKEWTKEINDPTPFYEKTVSRIISGNYGDVYILYKVPFESIKRESLEERYKKIEEAANA